MAQKYQNKYRIASARAQWWDYGWNGAYYITICTHNREHYFGEIKNGKMILSRTGVIADILWHGIPNHAPFVELGDFVVMPNHIHGILILDKPHVKKSLDANNGDGDDGVGGNGGDDVGGDGGGGGGGDGGDGGGDGDGDGDSVKTLHATSLAAISPKSNTISTIIRSYKSAVTRHANRLEFPNGWQERFHDHIIRNDADYQRISNYTNCNFKMVFGPF